MEGGNHRVNLKQTIYTSSLIHTLSFHSFPRPTHSILTVSMALKESIFRKSLSSVLSTNLLEEGRHVGTGTATEDRERSFPVKTHGSSLPCPTALRRAPQTVPGTGEVQLKKLMNAA